LKITFVAICISLLTLDTSAQNINKIIVDESANGKNMADYLLSIEQEYQVDFVFTDQSIRPLIIGGIQKRIYMYSFLDSVLEPFNFAAIRVKDNVIFILGKPIRDEFGKKKDNYRIIKTIDPGKLSGRITDGASGQPIIGSQVTIPNLQLGVLTDEKGYFELSVPDDEIFQIYIQYLGYDTKSYVVGFSQYGSIETIEATLNSASIQMEGITVTANRSNEKLKSTVAGVERLDIESIKELPTFFGEVDPVRSLTTLPGVSTSGEISSGFHVRGGQSGQNLIKQDHAIVFNPTHLFGFFSAFNPDMINSVTLYKGGGPANFGGRVASVLDIKLRNGDVGRLAVKGGVGMISSRLTIEGPVVKGKSSFLVGGRIAYPDWLLKATKNIDLRNSSANFNDLNAKFFHTINENNFISISGYRSYDDFHLNSDSTFAWGTTNISVNWDHTYSDKLISTVTFASSNYYSDVVNNSEIEAFEYRNSIKNLSLKSDFIYTRDESAKYTFGFEANSATIEPGKLVAGDRSNATPVDISDQHSLELAAFIQSELELSSKWALSAGLRYSHFLRLGEDAIYTFDYNKIEGRYPAIVDTTNYSNNQLIESYHGLEPRISLRYLISPNSSLKASYYRGLQYLHLVSNTTSIAPYDYWIASGPYLKPQIGNQYSLGYFGNLKDNIYEYSAEVFYKDVANTVDYIEGADVTLNAALEAGLSQGRGTAYGVELFLKKNEGPLTGWLSYTYSRSLLEFDSSNEILRINEGDQYPSNYDQPHDFSAVISYKLGPRTTLSSNFNYKTGRPITIPISKFTYDAYLAALNYSSRNEYRIPDYHRLDLSLSIKDRERKNTSFQGEWVISIFNLYGRENAYSVYFNKNGRAYKLSILGNIFPSVTYNFRF